MAASNNAKASKWYWVAGILSAAGFLSLVVPVKRTFDKVSENKIEIEAPGRWEINFQKSGTYTLYHVMEIPLEAKDLDFYERKSKDQMLLLHCKIVSKSGERLLHESLLGGDRSRYGDRLSIGLFKFKVESEGLHTVDCSYAVGTNPPKAKLLIMQTSGSTLAALYFLGIFSFFVLEGLALLIVLVTALRSDKTRKVPS